MIRYILILIVVFSPQLNAKPKLVLTFGLYTSDKPSTMVKQFRPILNELEKALQQQLQQSVKIKTHVATSYEQGLANLAQGKVDFSRVGPASYILAKRQNNQLKILVMEHKKGKKEFYGVIAVKADSDIKSVKQLKGKRFAFGDDKSTIGRYLAQQYLLENGLRKSDLAGFEYLDRHDKVGAVVSAGHFDAGALKFSTFKRLVKKGHKLREIARFKNITKPWVARAGIPASLLEALQAALLSLKHTPGLNQLNKSGFLMAKPDDYDTIRRSIEINPQFFQQDKP